MHERNEIVQSYQQKQRNKSRNTEPWYIYIDGERNQHYYYKTQAINFLKLFKENCYLRLYKLGVF